MKDTTAARFWAKVIRGAKAEDCWEWTGTSAHFGHGALRYFYRSRWTNWAAHRVSWVLHRGPIPEGLWVLHRCHNPGCTNPAHLYLGTHFDNTRDMVEANRQARPKGEKHGAAKLNDHTVMAAARLRLTGWSVEDLANKYNVKRATIGAALRGRNWKHLPLPWDRLRGINTFYKLTPETRAYIVAQREEGVTCKKIAAVVGVARSRITQVVQEEYARKHRH